MPALRYRLSSRELGRQLVEQLRVEGERIGGGLQRLIVLRGVHG